MGFTVTDSPNSWTGDGVTATREYVIEWDGSGPTNTHLARVALDAYLSGFAEDYTTHAIRDLNADGADPFDPETERLLSFYLHGLPVQPYAVTEVAETEAKFYDATVTWGDTTDTAVNNFASAGASSRVSDDPDVEVTFTTRLSAAAVGRTIDYAPLVHVFVANTARAVLSAERFGTGATDWSAYPYVYPVFLPADKKAIPDAAVPFELGSLNAERPTADGEVVVNGLSYSAPSPDLTLAYNIKGPVLAAWVEEVARQAKRGVLNTDQMVINGITYPPYTLLLTQFDAEYQNDNTTTVNVGFATGYLTTATFTERTGAAGWTSAPAALAGSITNSTRYDTTFFAPNGSVYADFDAPFSLYSETAPSLVESVRVMTFSSHDYVWAFYNNYLDASLPSDLQKVNQREYICVHRIWGETAFGEGTEGNPGLFGVNEL